MGSCWLCWHVRTPTDDPRTEQVIGLTELGVEPADDGFGVAHREPAEIAADREDTDEDGRV